MRKEVCRAESIQRSVVKTAEVVSFFKKTS